MFEYSIDKKPFIKDPDGNVIVDLASKFFRSNSSSIGNAVYKKVTKDFEMRSDLIAQNEYNSTDGTEMILKYSGISNPFSLCEGDILMIPNMQEALEQTEANNIESESNKTSNEVLIKNFFKFKSDYKKDFSSYDKILSQDIPSGNIEKEISSVPYISADGQTSITIRNGRMYFGENNGISTAAIVNNASLSTSELDKKIKEVMNAASQGIEEKCLYNGTLLTDIVSKQNSK